MQLNQKLTFRVFFLSVLIGAFGLGLNLSPYSGLTAFYVMAFSVEIIRLGLLVINVQVRKENPERYKTIFGMVILITVLQALTIAAHNDWQWMSEAFLSQQTVNLAILFAEFSLAVLLAGPTPDVILNAQLKNQLKAANEKISQLEGAEKEVVKLKDLLKQEEVNKVTMAANEQELAALRIVHDSVLSLKGKKMSVNKVTATVCEKCSRVLTAPSNSQKPTHCTCGHEINWSNPA